MVKIWTAGKPKEPGEKSITQQMNEIINEICDNYCKYPEACMSEREDPEDAEDLLYMTYCEKCPLMKW